MGTHDVTEAGYRDWSIAAAVEQRRIAASEADDFRVKWGHNPQAYARLLTAPVDQGGLAAGLVPASEQLAHAAAAPDAYDERWLSRAEQATLRAARKGAAPAAPERPRIPAPPPPEQADPAGAALAAADTTHGPSAGTQGSESPAYPDGQLTPGERGAIEARERGEQPPQIGGDGDGGRPPS